jgi:predicted membrane-bound mannosyltransferase
MKTIDDVLGIAGMFSGVYVVFIFLTATLFAVVFSEKNRTYSFTTALVLLLAVSSRDTVLLYISIVLSVGLVAYTVGWPFSRLLRKIGNHILIKKL